MKARRNTKQRILNEAEVLFRERSYRGFSYHDISKSLGIKNAAIHYHYPAKADLGVALIDRFREALNHRVTAFAERAEDPVKALDSYFEYELGQCNCNATVCPLGVIATDFCHLPKAMRDHGRLLAGEVLQWLTRILELGKKRGSFKYQGKANDKAIELMSSVQGARQLARLSGINLLNRAIGQIRKDLGLAP